MIQRKAVWDQVSRLAAAPVLEPVQTRTEDHMLFEWNVGSRYAVIEVFPDDSILWTYVDTSIRGGDREGASASLFDLPRHFAEFIAGMG